MQQPIKVLIADDNRHMRGSLQVILSAVEEFQIVGEASNGEEAVKMAKELQPDIVLLDINMTPVNGFEATRQIVKHNPGTKIIALSLHKEASYCRNILSLGARGYVTKSSRYVDIIDAIKAVADGGSYIDKSLQGKIY
jgi:two-component system, NarL family, invasion response regulator UvrY